MIVYPLQAPSEMGRRRIPFHPRPSLPLRQSARVRGYCRFTALALLAAYLLFCHGCYGDEDHELFACLAASRRPELSAAVSPAISGTFPP
jgi:hypothetical protein